MAIEYVYLFVYSPAAEVVRIPFAIRDAKSQVYIWYLFY